MPKTRRDFLSWLGAGSMLAPTGSLIPNSMASAQEPKPVNSTWDVSWTERLTGKYKAIFDCLEIEEGIALFRAAPPNTPGPLSFIRMEHHETPA